MAALVRRGLARALTTVLAVGVAAGCRSEPDASRGTAKPVDRPAAGTVTVDGSSTLLPIAKAFAAAFEKTHPGITVAVTSSTTAAGFNRLCAGEIDIAAASRPINTTEMQACRARSLEFLELPVAFDSVTVVVNPANTFARCLTVDELKTMWQPGAEGRVSRWSDIRRDFPDESLALHGPASTSGTFDYFTLAIVGTQGRSRSDYTKSDDDEVLVNAIASQPNAVAYFGYAYYRANQDRWRAVSIDNGAGCVAPSVDTVKDGSYQPLTRPLFLYASGKALDRPEVLAYARYAASVDRAGDIEAAGYLPLPPVTSLTIAKHIESRTTGSIFGGRGAVLGITPDSFADDDRVKNALVR